MIADDRLCNDIHSRLNPTRVHRVATPRNLDEVRASLAQAAAEDRAVSICGGRHAMGGQQFGRDALLIDTVRLDRVLSFDGEAGTVEVEAGIQWPALVGFLLNAQEGRHQQWGIIQKQTGADALSLGGSRAANIHSRGLRMRPIVDDVLEFTLLDARGRLLPCSRTENRELFRLAIGGYGLFGLI
jgi:FAD/FMN-containing dehydrogenase